MRPRFSLRLFLIAFTLLAILFGAAANFVYRIKSQAHRHKVAVEKLKELGVWIQIDEAEYDGIVTNPTAWELWARTWIDEDAYKRSKRAIANFRGPATDVSKALDYLPDVAGLYELDLKSLILDDETCEQLSRLSELKSLSVDDLEIHSTAVTRLKGLQKLTRLKTLSRMTSDTAERLAAIPHLQDLRLNASELGERGANTLSALKELRRVELIFDSTAAPQGSAPLAALLRCENLTELHLSIWTDGDFRMEGLKHASRIKVFSVFSTAPLPGALYPSIVQMKSLEVLSVHCSSHLGRAQDLSTLTTCSELRTLDLSCIELDGNHFRQLSPLKNLRHLRCCGQFQQREFMDFLKAHPLCEIDLCNPGASGRAAAGCKYKLVNGELSTEKYSFASF